VSAVLEAFAQALAREAHVLSRDPQLMRQQLVNRLQWSGEDVQRLLPQGPTNATRGIRAGSTGRRVAIRRRTPFHESAALVRTVDAHSGGVMACAFDPKGARIVSVGADGTLRQWDGRSGELLRSTTVTDPEYRDAARCCAVSPDGQFAVCGCTDGTLVVQSLATGTELWATRGSFESVTSCVVHPAADRLLWTTSRGSGRGDDPGSVTTLVLDSAETAVALVDLLHSPAACALSPTGELLAVGTREGDLVLWPLGAARPSVTIAAHAIDSSAPSGMSATGLVRVPQSVNAVAFSPDGADLLSAGDDAALRLWDPWTGENKGTLVLQDEALETRTGFGASLGAVANRLTACAWSRDRQLLVSGSQDGVATVWDTGSRAAITRLRGHSDEVTACAVSPDDLRLLTGSRDGTFKLWDLARVRGGGS
jgi:WD40 repeat protein